MAKKQKNQMVVNGKAKNDTAKRLTINLADDQLEVRGFGQAITREFALQMAERYFTHCERGWEVVQEIENNPKYAALKKFPGFAELKHVIDPSVQTVSGVFGKEIILQILSMRNCEGIRYIIGNDGTQNTVIIIGVAEEGTSVDSKGKKRAKSVPVKLLGESSKGLDANDVPIDGEVHNESLTIAGVRESINTAKKAKVETGRVAAAAPQSPTDILFGAY
jgi:hypothetical protein